MLAIGRALQGVGSAGMMSVNTALVRFTYPRRQLGRGIAMTAVTVSVTSAAGPTVAAAILAVGVMAMAVRGQRADRARHLVLSLRLLPRTPPSEHRFDLASAVLSAVAFAVLIGGINGIGHGQAPAFVAVGVAGAHRRRICAGAPADAAADAVVAGRFVPAPDIRAVGGDFGDDFCRPGHHLCYIAVLFPGRARPLAGRDRAVDDAVAGDGGGDSPDRRPARRPLSGRDSRRHRAQRR